MDSSEPNVEETSDSQPKRPRLARVDGKRPRKDDLERRRFGIVIQSVYYYPSSGGVCCAVLLKTSFELKVGEKLASALVPLSAKPLRTSAESTSIQEEIDITGHFPATAEWAHVAQLSRSRETQATPNIKITFLGTGIHVSGIGVNKSRLEDRSYKILLNPDLNVLAGHPTYLNWKFEDPKGIFYPPSTNLLVVVEKSTNKHELWFPFELILEWPLRVDIHGLLNRIIRLVVRPDRHAGWCFPITGQYNPGLAQDALEEARRSDATPSIVGLHAAVKPWADVHPSSPP